MATRELFLSALAAAAVISAPAFAVDNTGTGQITADITAVTTIHTVSPIGFNTDVLGENHWNDTPLGDAYTTTSYVCLTNNNTTPEYTITVQGSGADNAFTITNGTDTLAYTATWLGNAQTTATALTYDAGNDNAVGEISADGLTSNMDSTCGGDHTGAATLAFSITHAAVKAVTAGEYRGTMAITVVSGVSGGPPVI